MTNEKKFFDIMETYNLWDYIPTLNTLLIIKTLKQWQDSEDAVELAPAKEEVELTEKERIECPVEELVFKQLIP